MSWHGMTNVFFDRKCYMIPTPHIEATDKSMIASTVLMPGDPLRAKFIADTYLENIVQFNQLRGMLGFTGTYKNKRVSVMGSGMGLPSIGIYSYELFKFYDVENIIRVGSCGAYHEDYEIYDLVLARDAFSESTYMTVQNGDSQNILQPSMELNQKILQAASARSIPIKHARVHSSDVFYGNSPEYHTQIRDQHKCNVKEMEAFALFANAKSLNKHAACVLTVSDIIPMPGSHKEPKSTSAHERQHSFHSMVELVLESI